MPDSSEEYEGERVLVTGGAGAIGSILCKALSLANAEEVVILDDLSSSYEWNIPRAENIVFVRGNIIDDEVLKHVFRRRPDYVFHLAAHFANQNSVENPERNLLINGMGILKVLEYASLTGVKRFVYSSSGCGVYGTESRMPFKEDDISISLHTPYQVTKLLGELYTNYFWNLFKLPIVNARFFNVYGPGEVPGKYRNVIPNFFYWSLREEPLPITGDGTETRDFTYVDDIIGGLLAMGVCEEAIGEAINLGSFKETRIADLAKIINDLTGNPNGTISVKSRDWDKKKRLLSSIEKATKILGYKPRTEIREGLKRVHSWFLENKEKIDTSAAF